MKVYNLGYYLATILCWVVMGGGCCVAYKGMFYVGEMDLGLQHLDWFSAYVLGLFNAALIMNMYSRVETQLVARGWKPPY